MKCPFCHIMPTGARDGIVRFDCGMVMAAVAVQQLRPDEIEAYRLHQPTACIRGERDRYLRSQARLSARVAELEERCKRLEDAARAVYLDSIASDHPWSTNETRNMHALRDVLEAKP